ncbi:MAG: hypothetical protein AUH92_06525 [Acidobacteria bacterium 13_1_40CM_4_69_4]|nr:MAG: hypothetical protein AUH92_06525 [Acidobacteria bacterium 13_1_40CM_4_69_4]
MILLLLLLLAVPACAGGPAAPVRGAPVLVVSDRGGALRIYEEAEGGGARLVGSRDAADPRYSDTMPARLPDGRIVFVSDRDGNPGIYVAAADGRATRVTFDPPERPAADSAPAPLGRDRIVFARGEPGAPPGAPRDLYTQRLDGTGARRLTRHPADEAAPSASGDGRSIVFVSNRSGADRIYLIPDIEAPDPEAGTVCLSNFDPPRPSRAGGGGEPSDGAPAFLPDGSIVFRRAPAGGVPHLYIMGRNGARAGLRQITDSLTLPFGASEPVALDEGTILFDTGPVYDREKRGGPVRFAVYRIALGGFNLTRLTRERATYSDFTRHLPER